MKRILLFLANLVVLAGCGSPAPKQPTASSEATQAVMQEFERASSLLDKGMYTQAARVFDQITVKNPTTEFELVVAYNAATAYEGMKKCQVAADRYRQIVRTSLGKFPRIEAQALLRLSYAAECLGQDSAVISSLLDVMKRRQYLPLEQASAEVPARLAGAYARLGNRTTADKYFREAEKGLRQLQNNADVDISQKRDLMARTLFLMGKIEPEQIRRSDSGLQSLKFSQVYLLKAVELESPQWSKQAHDNLLGSYDLVWERIQAVRPPDEEDPGINQQIFDKRKTAVAMQALECIEALKKSRFPDPKEPHLVADIFDKTEKHRGRLRSFLASVAVQNRLTPEAANREGLRREGRIQDSGAKKKTTRNQ